MFRKREAVAITIKPQSESNRCDVLLFERKRTWGPMFSAFDALLYVRKTEKNRNEIRAVPLCILKPGHLEFEASQKVNLRKLKETKELGTKGAMNGFVNVVRSWVAEFCTVVVIIIIVIVIMIMMIIVILAMMIIIILLLAMIMGLINDRCKKSGAHC